AAVCEPRHRARALPKHRHGQSAAPAGIRPARLSGGSIILDNGERAMVDKIGVAFVGCTHPHIFPRIDLLRADSDVTLVGCYDPDAALTAALQERHGLKAYDTPEALLDQPGVN